MSIVAVGRSSFIAQAVRDMNPGRWEFLSHREALENPEKIRNARSVINFAYDPRLKTDAYSEEADIDLKLAKMIANNPVHYIMISSRMVYGRPTVGLALRETDTPSPVNIYGQSKLETEKKLADTLKPERLTILRLSNVFGFEPGRRSFFGMAQTKLLNEGRIVYDMSPLTKRDFISVTRVSDALVRIASAPKAGIYNLGAGFGIETGLIAEWLIEGFGSGELLVNRFSHDDQFFLDMTRTAATYGIKALTADHIRGDCLSCGERLKRREAA